MLAPGIDARARTYDALRPRCKLQGSQLTGPCVRAYVCACVRACVHACMRACIRACVRPHSKAWPLNHSWPPRTGFAVLAHSCTRMHARTHARTHACTHPRTHAFTHEHIHLHTQLNRECHAGNWMRGGGRALVDGAVASDHTAEDGGTHTCISKAL